MISGDDFLRQLLKQELDLRAFIGSLVPDRNLREDIFQEVVLTLWRRLEDYDPARSLGAWARGIAAKRILKLSEKNQRFPLLLSPEIIQAIVDAFDRTEESVDRRLDALRECLKLLPDRSRELLRMRYEQGLPSAEIARQTQNTPDAVYQALSRIRARLEDCIRNRLAAPKEGA